MTSSWNAIGWLIFGVLLAGLIVIGALSGTIAILWAWMGFNTAMAGIGMPNWAIALIPVLLVVSFLLKKVAE